MSASPIARQAHSHAQLIPAMRKVLINDASQMPDVYSSTPNGTIYSTTPNGTKIVYERTFLLNLRNSPLSHTPPKNVPCHLMKDDNSPFHNHNHQNQLKDKLNGTHQHHPPKNNHHHQHHHNKAHNNNNKNSNSTEWRRPSAASAASDDHQFDMDM